MTNPSLLIPSYPPSHGRLSPASGPEGAAGKSLGEESSATSFRSVMQKNTANQSPAQKNSPPSSESGEARQAKAETDGESPTEEISAMNSAKTADSLGFDSGRRSSELLEGVARLLDAPEAVIEESGIDVEALRVALENSEESLSELSDPMAAPLLWASGNPLQQPMTGSTLSVGEFVNALTPSLSQAFPGAQPQLSAEGRMRASLLTNTSSSQSGSPLSHSALAVTTAGPANTVTADATGLSLHAAINVDPEALDLSRFAGDKLLFLQQKARQGESSGLQVAATESSALHESPLGSNNLADGFKGRVQVPMQVHFSNNHWPQNLAEQTAALLNQRVSSADIQLDPPELGPLQVRIQVNQDQATVNFVSANPQVREALDLGLMRLKEMLQEQGMQLVDSGVSDQPGEEHQEQTEGEPAAPQSGASLAQQPADESDDKTSVTTSARWGIDDFA